ncbi:MAG: FkbM family methyltransferase [Phenylobacterium sp.]|uniref:FkbM family methyltransferase n=1 Tax=Phenylobacterium sp. TaxID=1871053 RepID=UPI0027313D12|nr:FkbM family methyltransferase [Phenylobacterium sp.]MDP2009976.1 FkbM family methyltransferase [Phenylobacterium sp.]
MATRDLFELLALERPLQVADIGAADLGEAPVYKALVDAGLAQLNAFDADPRQHAALRQLYGDRVRIFPQVVGDGAPATLYLAAPQSGMTSLFRPSTDHLAFFNGFERLGQVERELAVETTRLDDIEDLPELDFLKMDIQGGELAALRHGTAKLARCAMVQLEVSFVPLYEGQPSFGDIDVWMRGQGFIPHCFTALKKWSIAPVLRDGDFRSPFNQLLEADIVYVRDPVAPGGLDPELMKAVALLAHHNFYSIDLAGRMIALLAARGDLPADAFERYLALVNAGA